jgi:hypothetical protein
MTHRTKEAAIRKLLAKDLTGWEAGKLILQDYVDANCGKPSFLSDADKAAIINSPMQGQDVQDYNTLIALGRMLEKGLMICNMACKEACLDLSFLIILLRDVNNRSTVELFASFGPHVVTRKQYEDIVAAQKEKKLVFEYNLAYVIEERFYAIAPPEAKKEIDELCVDIESGESFMAVVPEKYSIFYKQAITKIHELHTSGKIKSVYHDADAKEAEALLDKWGKNELSAAEAMKFVDMLFVNGKQLYECKELPEWKKFIDEYQQHWVSDDDARFRHAYAILEDCPESWIDENGYYKNPLPPSEWITKTTEISLGLQAEEGKKTKSISCVSLMLQTVLSRIELNARIFLAIKAILEAAVETVELDVTGEGWLLYNLDEQLKLYSEDYNHQLTMVKEEPKSWSFRGNKLQKVLKTLPAVDLDKLKPAPESMKQLKEHILTDIRDNGWLQIKLRSLRYIDGFCFASLMGSD